MSEVGTRQRFALNESDVGTLARIVATEGSLSALAFLRALAERGVAIEHIFQQLLAGAARRLQEDWLVEKVALGELTRGLDAIEELVGMLSSSDDRGEVHVGIRSAGEPSRGLWSSNGPHVSKA